jgi:N-acylneuraminate cytidylyltransferase
MRIAVIPARGGSKRIPRKNIRPFCGKPMMAWSVDAARDSGLFDHVLVSTDDPEISAIAVKHGAEAPFARPAELANDHAGTIEVIAHTTLWAREQGWPVGAVCCIYATAPFVEIADIRRGLQELETGDWDYAFSATDFPAPIFRAFKRRADGGVEMFFPEHFLTRSQDLPVALHDAAQFYWGRPAAWIEGRRIFGPRSIPIMVPRWRVQDIDNEDDWRRAEIMAPLIMNRKR